MQRGVFVTAVVLWLAPGARAQEDAHAGCGGKVGSVPREILERPLRLRRGTGNARDRVTTASREAQAFYDQGLNYLHGYVWIEAARSFSQALRLDPAMAMAHLGLSRAYTALGDDAEAKKALARAEALAVRASPREQRRIALRATQLEAFGGGDDKYAAYKKAIDEALAADVEDAELWLLRGNAEEGWAGGRGQRGGAASTAFYRTALQVFPDHAAAHHYLTHSYEMIGQIDKALRHGEAYARLAPAIPHAHHMWGHDLRRVGRIDDAIAVFKKADRLEKEYYASEDVAAEYDWHHSHNLSLLATAYQHKGSMRLAEATVRELVSLRPWTDSITFERKHLVLFLLERQRYEEALAAARELGGEKKDSGDRALAHALAGEVLLALGRIEAAREELAAAEQEKEIGGARRFVDTLRGQLLIRSPETAAEGRKLLEEVCRKLRTAPGADAWITALYRLETMARAARDAGDWETADFMARQMIEHDPSYAGSHFAMALVAQHRGDAAGARRWAADAAARWRRADRDLPELGVIAALGQPSVRAGLSRPAPARP